MWTGVTKGLAGIKFSGSPRSHGIWKEIINKKVKNTINPTKSFNVKYGWNGTLSKLLFSPKGLDDPVEWRNTRWMTENAAITNGNKKCKAKNRVNVAFLTEKPPHSQATIWLPITGIADAKLVITVAPQKDICPQGSTYPKNAVPITKSNKTTPTLQVTWKL